MILLFVQGFEKLRLVSYLPTRKDRPTIGWGHTGSDVPPLGQSWTLDQAKAAWATDTAAFAVGVSKAVYGSPTTQGQFDALFSLAYNIGLGNLRTSTLLRKHKVGDFAGAAAEFLRWDRQAGEELEGLEKRRKAEQAIYNS